MADENPDAHQTLPVRGRSSLPGGRHRKIGASDIPPDAPPLILAVPGSWSGSESSAPAVEAWQWQPGGDAPLGAGGALAGGLSAAAPGVVETIASLLRGAYAGIDVRITGVDTLEKVLSDTPSVVVPLVTGAHPAAQNTIREAVGARPVVVTDPLGPHPMLASALHARLADAGLARADRIRQFSIGAAVDGVVVATVGGLEAAREADMTAVLLAARLAVPVIAASLDSEPSVAGAVTRMKSAGAGSVAIAPYVIGPEADEEQLSHIVAQTGAGCANPLGAHESVVRLVGMRYDLALDDVYAARQVP